MPLPAEIGKAYANYYTHQAPVARRSGLAGRLVQASERSYLAGKYGYRDDAGGLLFRVLSKLFYLLPVYRQGVDGEVRFLPSVPGGRLLDVGCGSGEWLSAMREKGWRVAGTDFDENAVKTARQKGVDVVCGDLAQQNFPADHFDAVTLSHVIEHVPDPLATMVECFRILKPGGKLVLLTPNTASLSHKFFKQDWRGLEPPRHLHVFSFKSMRRALGRAGFGEIVIRPHVARTVILDSLRLRRAGNGQASDRSPGFGAKWFARAFNVLEACLQTWRPSVSDCVAAIAVKD